MGRTLIYTKMKRKNISTFRYETKYLNHLLSMGTEESSLMLDSKSLLKQLGVLREEGKMYHSHQKHRARLPKLFYLEEICNTKK